MAYSLYCAVIVKRVDAQTRAKTSINDLLRAPDRGPDILSTTPITGRSLGHDGTKNPAPDGGKTPRTFLSANAPALIKINGECCRSRTRSCRPAPPTCWPRCLAPPDRGAGKPASSTLAGLPGGVSRQRHAPRSTTRGHSISSVFRTFPATFRPWPRRPNPGDLIWKSAA